MQSLLKRITYKNACSQEKGYKMMHRHLILLVAFFSHCSRGRVIRPLNHCECGLTKDLEEGTITRIVGGQLANVNEFPWIVGLYTHYRCRGLPVCGGALVSSQHILTAAHCVQRKSLVL